MPKLTPLQENERKRLLAGIHIKKQELGIAEIQYRDLLWERYKVESSKELSLESLREFDKDLGFFPQGSLSGNYENGNASAAQIETMNKIYQEVADNKSALGMRKFIKRIVGRMPLYLESLSVKEAQKVIIALKQWQKSKENGGIN